MTDMRSAEVFARLQRSEKRAIEAAGKQRKENSSPLGGGPNNEAVRKLVLLEDRVAELQAIRQCYIFAHKPGTFR